MIYTEKLRSNLKEFLRSGPTGYTIERRTGIHRQIIARFSVGENVGLNYENGMVLRKFLREWEKEFGYEKKDIDTRRISKD